MNVPTRQAPPSSHIGWRTRLSAFRQAEPAAAPAAAASAAFDLWSTAAKRCSTALPALDRADKTAKMIAAAMVTSR